MGILCNLAAVRNCCCTVSSSRGSLPFTGLRPRLTCTPSKPTWLARATASTLPVRCRFQSVTPSLRPRIRAEARRNAVSERAAVPPPYKKDRREIFMDARWNRGNLSSAAAGGFDVDVYGFPLGQKQTPEAAEVVQDAAAGLNM